MLVQDVRNHNNTPLFNFFSNLTLYKFSVSTLQAAKPDKARQVEAMLISMAQRGQIQGQLGEEQLKSILEQVSSTKSQSTVSVSANNIILVTMNPSLDVKTNIFSSLTEEGLLWIRTMMTSENCLAVITLFAGQRPLIILRIDFAKKTLL